MVCMSVRVSIMNVEDVRRFVQSNDFDRLIPINTTSRTVRLKIARDALSLAAVSNKGARERLSALLATYYGNESSDDLTQRVVDAARLYIPERVPTLPPPSHPKTPPL